MSKSKMTIDKAGNKFWKNSRGLLHRVDGPATEYTDGYKSWLINGQRHRTDGPAVEWSNGEKAWWLKGEFLGYNDEGFWVLWDRLSVEDLVNPSLHSYLPGDFNV